jgi:sugar lactone lactonase YvrE
MSGRRALGLMVAILFVVGLAVAGVVASRGWRQNERLVAAGLRSPRGIALMPEDGLIVAEAGLPDVRGRADPARRATNTGRLTWIAEDSRGTLRDGLPGEYVGQTDELSGASAIVPAGGGRILMLFGACEASPCRALHALDRDGSLSRLVDFAAPLAGRAANASANPWGLAVRPDGVAFVSDAAAGDLVRVEIAGASATAQPAAAFGSASDPRGVAIGPDGAVYVALFGPGRIERVGQDGAISTVASGLTRPIALGFEPEGTLLVLEFASGGDAVGGFPARSGRLVRLDLARPDERQVISANLDYPTALLVAPDGRAYVANGGFHRSGPTGELLQIRRLGPRPPRPWF